MRKSPLRKLVLFILAVLILILLGIFAVNLGIKHLYPVEFEDYVQKYSGEYSVSPLLVHSVIKVESGYDPDAVSSIGARGLMQITEETFEWAKWRMGDEESVYADLFIPEKNIQYGTFILALLYEEFHNTKEVLAAYHAGFGSVTRWLTDSQYSTDGETLDTIPFKDTASYVPKVLETSRIYKKMYQTIFSEDELGGN